MEATKDPQESRSRRSELSLELTLRQALGVPALSKQRRVGGPHPPGVDGLQSEALPGEVEEDPVAQIQASPGTHVFAPGVFSGSCASFFFIAQSALSPPPSSTTQIAWCFFCRGDRGSGCEEMQSEIA